MKPICVYLKGLYSSPIEYVHSLKCAEGKPPLRLGGQAYITAQNFQPPVRIELTTPGLQDQCSSHWAMEAHGS